MSKRGIIIGGGLFVLLGIGCLGLTTIGGVGVWFAMSPQSVSYDERVYSEFGDHSGPAVHAEPMVAPPVEVEAEPDTDVDTDSDTDVDTAVSIEAAVTAPSSSPRPRRTTSSSSTAPRPFSAPEADEPIPEDENLDDMDLERTAIEIIDEELTPRERRRLRREERN
jgi:hypothetical protein